MIDKLDEITPQDLYLGRMVRELLKDGGTITINHHEGTPKFMLFSYDKGSWRNRACLVKDLSLIDLSRSPLSMAEDDAEDIILEYNRPKEDKND